MAWFKKSEKASDDSGQKVIRVLTIDDEPSITMGLKLNLEGMGGYAVEMVNDPRLAVSTAREFKPDIILLDVIMPGMDGGDIKAKFATDPDLRRIPVIMITALVSEDETAADTVVESGHNVMLGKPIKMAKLVACIEQMLAGQIR